MRNYITGLRVLFSESKDTTLYTCVGVCEECTKRFESCADTPIHTVRWWETEKGCQSEKEREEEERSWVESESAVAGCEFPLPRSSTAPTRLLPSNLVASITPRPSGESTYSPPWPLYTLVQPRVEWSASSSLRFPRLPSPSPSRFVVSLYPPLPTAPLVACHDSWRSFSVAYLYSWRAYNS